MSAAAPMDPARARSSGRGFVLPSSEARPLPLHFARHLARCQEAFLALGPQLPAALRASHARAVTALRHAWATDPRGTAKCFASPTLATPLQCLGLREALPAFRTRIDEAAAAVTPHLLLELALRGLLPAGTAIDWPQGPRPLATLSLGLGFVPPPESAGWRFTANRVEALGTGAGVSFAHGRAEAQGAVAIVAPYRQVGGVSRLAQWDHNPIAAFEAHPDKAGNPVDLGGRSEDEWVAALDEAFALLATHVPALSAEMSLLLHEVIPVGYDRERHLSASYREAIGTVYLTLHPHPLTMAEALVHEFQHGKLNLASYELSFLENPFSPLYRSPVRPDPRPLWGILLAVHAFLPVAVLYRRMREAGHSLARRPDFAARLSEIDLKNHEGIQMLRAHARWTAAGRALWEELEALDAAHMAERAAEGLSLAPTEVHLA